MIREYEIFGRELPTEEDPNKVIYKMRIFARNAVEAKSRFWGYLRQMRGIKLKKSSGQLLACKEVHETNRLTAKNFRIFMNYRCSTGLRQMRREFRATSRAEAVRMLFDDMAGRHRVDFRNIHIISVQRITGRDNLRTEGVKMFVDENVAFPILKHEYRPTEKHYGSTFKASRPNLF